MKILVVGRKSWETDALMESLQELRHVAYQSDFPFLFFDFDASGSRVFDSKNKVDISHYDAVIPRAPGPYYPQLQALVDYCMGFDIPVINEEAIINMPRYSKFYQHMAFVKHAVPFVPTFACGIAKFTEIMGVQGYPCIIKKFEGGLGAGVKIARNRLEADYIMNQFDRTDDVLIQKYIPIERDYRIVVVGNDVVGGMIREKPENSHLTNATGIDPSYQKPIGQIPPGMSALALQAARALKCGTAGVDIAIANGEMYVFEVNLFYGFRRFSEVTQFKTAESIVRLLEMNYQIRGR